MATSTQLYDWSIPTFKHYIRVTLDNMTKAEEHAKANGDNIDDYVDLRLAPDMNPFSFQIQIISRFGIILLTRVLLIEAADLGMPDGDDKTWLDLRQRLEKTLGAIDKHATPEAFVGKEDFVVEDSGRGIKMTARRFVQDFALPNFWFHISMAYALLRNKGVSLGKRNFLFGAQPAKLNQIDP